MADKNCAYLLDVLIGEMMLKDPPSILDYRRNPLCPILQIQSNVIPTVYIPFLSAESVSNHLSHIRSGHNFLPLEVEESYLNNGKFNFHSGKSCLFTTSSDSRPSEGLLNITILNSFCFPPTEFGKCQHRFNTVGEIKGKLEFYNSQGNIVAYIGTCLSLKVLGQGVALHSNKLKNEQSYETLKKYTLAESENDKYVTKSQNTDALRIDRSFSNINDDDSIKRREPALSNRSETNTGNVLRSIKQNNLSLYECSYEPIKSKKDTQSVYKSSKGLSSEEIALQLAELENNYNFIKNDDYLQYYEFQDDEVHVHPPSIVYSNTDKESEREWNRKLAKLVSSEENRDYEESFIKENSKSLLSSSGSSIYDSEEVSVLKNKVPKKDYKTKECTKQNKIQCDKSIRNKPRLKGWLRSTPVITQSTSLKQPQAKQTRTTLLRKSKTDPELAKQMQLEIERQVKQKLKILDANFKSEMEGFKPKRSHKNKLFNERLCSSKKSGSTEQLITKVKLEVQHQHFVDSNEKLSSRNKAFSQLDSAENTGRSKVVSPENIAFPKSLHQKERESDIDSKRFQHNENNLGSRVNIDEYRATFKKPYVNNVPPSNSDANNEKYDSRKFDTDLDTLDTPADKIMWSSGSLDAKVFVENFPEEASIGESLLSNSTNQNYENEELSTSSQVDSNGSKVSDAFINNQRKDSTQENNSFISNHLGSITKSEPKRNSSRSSTNKLRERKIHESYRNSSNSMDFEMQRKNISLLKKGSGSKSTSHKSHTVKNKKTSTSVDSIVDSETESQATDISEDILEDDKIVISKNSSYSYSSKGLSSSSDLVLSEGAITADDSSSSSDLVLSEGAITADDSSVDSQIISKMSRIKSEEKVNLKAENHRKQKSKNSISLSGSRSEYLQESFGKYSYSEDDSIKLSPSTQANPKETKNKKNPLGIDDVDSSISDISARIAALLMPRSSMPRGKPNVVESIQTDSISSYVPSSIDGSLSSLSDI